MFLEVNREYSLFDGSERYYHNTNWNIQVQLLDMSEGNVHYLIGYGGIIIKGNEITINSCLCVSTT